MSAHRCDIDGVPLVTTVLYKVLKDLLENDREVFTDPVEMGLWLKELEAQPGCFCYQTLKNMKREKE